MFRSDHQFNLLGISQKNGYSKGFEFDDNGEVDKQNHLIPNDDKWEGAFGSNQVHDGHAAEGQQLQQLKDCACFDDLYFNMEIPPFQSCEGKIEKLVDDDPAAFEGSEHNDAKKEIRPYYAGSLQILKNYRKRFRRLNVEKMEMPSYKECISVTCQRLSTDAILRLAAQNFIQCSYQGCSSESSVFSHPYVSSFGGLCEEDSKNVQLVQYLLASAEKVGEKQFERAGKLLLECDELSSVQGNPVERLVYYFSGALHERIDRETGTVTPKILGKMQSLDLLDTISGFTPDIIAMKTFIPFSQVSQFAGIQAILDQVADATKIHIVNLEIRTGMHYTILMQAIATRSQNPLEYLKVTAVGNKSRTKIEETGKLFSSFAQALNLKFSFNIVMVADILDLNENLFEIKADEAVAVWVEYYLMFMIGRQDMLESLMKVIKAIHPRVMIVTEVEGNHNSQVFVTRFIEALFHYGAFYDCLEDCLKHDRANRMFVESIYFSQAIRNIVATEGEERTIRHVAVNVWKAFFALFGMVQVELSMSSMYQANLVLNNFDSWNSCTLDVDGKSLLIGWKGTPIHSLSAWKFR